MGTEDPVAFRDGAIDGVRFGTLTQHHDDRGWLTELYRMDEPGILPVMAYISHTKPGVLRGPHEHRKQTDHFCFIRSAFIIYLWDARPKSSTYGVRQQLETLQSQIHRLSIPPGVVHAYRCSEAQAGLVVNMPDALFAGVARKEPVDEIRHEDDPQSPYKPW